MSEPTGAGPREQDQFLDVVDRDTAERLWWEAVRPGVLGAERVSLWEALGRVLAEDVIADVDVPSFDRANVDGYAVRAEDTYGSAEETPQRLRLNAEDVRTGLVPCLAVGPGTATPIATGAMLPRGADAVVMVEHANLDEGGLLVRRPVAPGAHVSFAGTDIARGELVLRTGTVLTARETGTLAAIGRAEVAVVRRPRVAIISTGDEIIEPGTPARPGSAYDANATLLGDAVREHGGLAVPFGVVPDDEAALERVLERALTEADAVLISGGTSKGAGDLTHRVLRQKTPGIIVHGVALKPGKPVCLGAVGSTPLAILPGFPTSAIFTFHEFVAPVLRRMAGLGTEARATIEARMAMRCPSERGRTEYLLVGLVPGDSGLTAYPMGKGSGSVTTFSRADGFVIVPRHQEYLGRGETVIVTLLGKGVAPVDLVAIGSHCIGLDWLLGQLARRGVRSKTLWVGSQGGLDAAARGECDLAGTHLLDPATDTYNAPFLADHVRLLRGYGRMQVLVFRPGDARFKGRSVADAIDAACDDPACFVVNRNRGSGTRVLLDGLLLGRRPPGSAVEVRSHNAVAAAVAQGRADWGVAIEPVAAAYGLAFTPVRMEQYDFAVPAERWDRPAVATFRALLDEPSTARALKGLGLLAGQE
jgi:putative molybdopterin biosynthesis protein